MIHPKFFITAAHNVFDHTNGAGFADSMVAIPSYKNGEAPYGMSNAVQYFTFSGWTQNENFDLDLALMELDRPLGPIVDWFGYGWNSVNSFYSGRTFFNPGFPAEAPYDGEDLYMRTGTFDTILTERFEFSPSSVGGHDGSSANYENNGGYFVHANQSYNVEGQAVSGHVRMTQTKFDAFQAQIANTVPFSPDLFLLDVDVSPESVDVGNQVSSLDYIIYNSSTSTWNGRIFVDFYLSDNDLITTGDTYLQTRTWNGSLLQTHLSI